MRAESIHIPSRSFLLIYFNTSLRAIFSLLEVILHYLLLSDI
jgi:hypothetical protein